MTPEQRQRVAEEFQRLSGLTAADVPSELQRLRDFDPTVASEIERLLASDGGRSRVTESPAVSEQLRGALGAVLGGSGPTLRDERGSPRIVETQRVGPYRVIRELGHGGLGYVLLCVREDDRFHKRVAVKLVKRGMDTEEILRRFEQERQVLSALNHPNIARVFDAGTTQDGRPYFVMEYVDGVPIDTYCDSQGLSTEERLKLFRKVCVAVHYAHQNLIVHRDIKPTNIMVTPDGEPKLLDFGIAKLLNPDLLFSPVTTGPELRLMTPEYASPEQVEGMPITTSSDVYSLGVLLYTLLTGHAPYKLRNRLREEIVRVVCNTVPERPSTSITKAVEVESADGTTRTVTPEEVAKNRDVQVSRLRRRLAGDIDNIVLMAMRKKPPRRYKSAEQFADDIDRHLSGKPVIASPETWVYVTGKFIGRNRLGVAAVLAVIVSLATGLALAAWQWREAQARYRQVLGLARAHIDQQKQIGDRVGSAAAQRILVEASLPALDALASVAKPNAELHDLLARGYSALGSIEKQWPESGSLNRAIEAYSRAVTHRRASASTRPGDLTLRIDLGMALVDLATAQWDGDTRQASDLTLKEALAIALDATARQTQSANAKWLLASVKFQEARQLASSRGSGLERAESVFQESVSILIALQGTSDADAKSVGVQLAAGLIEMGILHEGAGRPSEAEEKYKAARATLAAMRGTAAESADVQRTTVVALGKLGHLIIHGAFEGGRRLEEAVSYLEQARDIAIRLANDDPLSEANALVLRRYFELHGHELFEHARKLSVEGRADEAKVWFAKALAFMRPFLDQSERARQANPVPDRFKAVAVGHENIAEIYRGMSDWESARDEYKQAIDYYRAAAGSARSEWLKKRTGTCWTNLAAVYEALKDTSQAIAAYGEGVVDLEAGLNDGQHREFTQWLLSIAARNLGCLLLEKKDDAAGALPSLLKARDMLGTSFESEPHQVHMLLGRVYTRLTPPNLAAARAAFEEAMSAYGLKKAPDDRDHQIMMITCLRLGALRREGGDIEASRTVLQQGLDTYSRVSKPDVEIEQLRAQLADSLGQAIK